jgi:hypothetical protein
LFSIIILFEIEAQKLYYLYPTINTIKREDNNHNLEKKHI